MTQVEPSTVGVPFAEVGWRCCWFPLGELLEQQVRFSGHQALGETSWCAEHHEVVYRRELG